MKLQYKTGCQPCHHPKLFKCTVLLSHWHMKSLKGQEFSWLYINTIHLFRVEKSTTEVSNKKKKSVSPSSQPKSLQLPPGNYLRNKQVLIDISAVGREFCIAASTVPTVLTTAQLYILCYTDTSQRSNSETELGHTNKDVASWEWPWYKTLALIQAWEFTGESQST